MLKMLWTQTKEAADKAVEQGDMTQEQADAQKTKADALKEAVDDMKPGQDTSPSGMAAQEAKAHQVLHQKPKMKPKREMKIVLML